MGCLGHDRCDVQVSKIIGFSVWLNVNMLFLGGGCNSTSEIVKKDIMARTLCKIFLIYFGICLRGGDSGVVDKTSTHDAGITQGHWFKSLPLCSWPKSLLLGWLEKSDRQTNSTDDLDEAPGSFLSPGLVLAITDTWRVNQRMGDLSLSLCLFFVCNSDFQRNK